MKKQPILEILGKEAGEVALNSHSLTTEICHLHDINPGDPVTLVLLDHKISLVGVITHTVVAENKEGKFFYDAQIFFEIRETIHHLPSDSTPSSAEFVQDLIMRPSRIWDHRAFPEKKKHLWMGDTEQVLLSYTSRAARAAREHGNNCPVAPNKEDDE